MGDRSLFIISRGELLTDLWIVRATVGIHMLLKHGVVEGELIGVVSALIDTDLWSLRLFRKDSRHDHALIESFLGAGYA